MKIQLNKISKSLIKELAKDENVKQILINNEVIVKEQSYIKIPLRYIQDTKDNEELACLLRNIAENY